MKNEQVPEVYYRGNEFVMVQKAQEGFGPGSVVCVDANEDGDFELESIVGSDGIWCMTFELVPNKKNKQGQPFAEISIFMRSSDGSQKAEPTTFVAIQEATDNPAKAIPVNCAVEVSDDPEPGTEETAEPGTCTCTSCWENSTLLGSSLDGFITSYTPIEVGVETATGKYRNGYHITSFKTQMLGFNLNLHHASMVKYDGPVGQSFSHSYNMMIVQTGELTGQIITPDLRIFELYSEDGINWHLPKGFYSRLCLEPETNRWILTHYSGLEIAFYTAIQGCAGYPISIREANDNTACMTYSASGHLQDVTTDLGQIQRFQYDINGRFASYTDHINRTWEFPHDAEGRLSGITTPVTTFANIPASREIIDKDLDDVLVTQERCWLFGYQDNEFPNQITSETDPRGATYRENVFDDKGRVVTARIRGGDIRFDYDSVKLPFDVEKLEAGNLIRSITDREGNVSYQEIHGIQGGPRFGLGRFGLRRTMVLTERGKGNTPLRDEEPNYWEQRWLQDCECLVPAVATQTFSSNDLPDLEFDNFDIPTNAPREIFTFNELRQKTAWTYTDGIESISNQWTYQRDAFGDNQQFSRMLTETDPREFEENQLSAGVNFIHTHEYDAFGNHTRHEAPVVTRGTDTPKKIVDQWVFNSFGQPLSHIDPNGNIVNYAYFRGSSTGGDMNTKGRFGGYLKSTIRGVDGSKDPSTNLKREFKVNSLGLTTRLTDEKGFIYETKYNDLQEVECEVEPLVTLINGKRVNYQTLYVFDGAGNIVMTRRSNIDVDGTVLANALMDRSASFDVVNNRLTERVEIDDNDENDLVTRFAFDGNDDPVITQRPDGNRTFSVHDERRLPFKTFYGVASVLADPIPPKRNSASGEGYPSDKRASTLGNTSFVGLLINTYDARQNWVRERDGRGNESLHVFDFYNRQIAFSDQNGNGWVREFDDASNVVTSSRGAVDKTTGQMTDLLERSYSRFDEVGRPFQQVLDIDLDTDERALVDPDDGKNSSYLTVFDLGSRIVENRDANNNSTTREYDAADRLLVSTDALGNQRRTSYDANSNVIKTIDVEIPGPRAKGVSESYVTTMGYDDLNRLVEQRHLGLNGDSINHAWFFAYDSRNNQRLKQDAENNFVLSSFDDSDRKVKMQRFDGNPLDSSPTELLHYEWGYEKNSNLIEVRALSDVNDPNSIQITRYAFDDLDRLVRTVYPDSDDPIDGSNNGADGIFDRIEIDYDANSNPLQVTDQRGVVFNTNFDPGNRPTEQNMSMPEEVPGTNKQSFSYDALNRATRANNNYANIDRNFDAFSRLTMEIQSIRLDGSGFENGWEQPIQVAHRYDKQSNRIAYQVLDGNNTDLDVATTFDVLNRTDDISAAYFKTPTHSIARYAYIGPGRVQQKMLGNGAALTCTYDPKRRLRTHQWKAPTRILAGFEYDYDRMDNTLYERFDHDEGRCDHFQYNDRYEVTGVSYRVPGSVPPAIPTHTFEYDDVFNRRQGSFGGPFDTTVSTTDSYVSNRANEYAQITRNGNATEPTHDRAGNATRFSVRPVINNPNRQDVTADVRWDPYNLLFDMNFGGANLRQDYRYDPLRRRIVTLTLADSELENESRRYIYDGWSVVEERLFAKGARVNAAPSSLERIYVNGMQIDEPLLTAIDRNQDGELGGSDNKNMQAVTADQEYFFLNNRLGSVMALLDADNANRVLEYYRYTIYGEPTVLPVVDENGDRLEEPSFNLSDHFKQNSSLFSVLGNAYLYTARRFDKETGLTYYRARYFNSSQGRFVSRDLFGYISSINLYEYVVNNPCNYVDPWGDEPKDCSKVTKAKTVSVSSGDLDHWEDANSIGKRGQSIYSMVRKLAAQLKKCECMEVLTLKAHGNPSWIAIRGRKTGEDWATYPRVTTGSIGGQTDITEANASKVVDLIKSVACFCKTCTIYILSCNVGLGKIPQFIANSSGCTVKAPMGYCYPDLSDPGDSEIVKETDDSPAWPDAEPKFAEFKPQTQGDVGSGSKPGKPGKMKK